MSAQLKIIDEICVGSKPLNREALLRYEEFAKTQPQVEIPATHVIHGGMYLREITIPKDTLITGQIYKLDHLDIMISGDVTVSTDSGERMRFKGYNKFKGLSGKKRAGYTHEDTTWITVHPVTGPDGEAIQKMITAETFEDLAEFYANQARHDYLLFLYDSGINKDEVERQSKETKDVDESPVDGVYLSDSAINGVGLFSGYQFSSGDTICMARVDGKRTIAGRYANHSNRSNAKMVISDGNALLVAATDIPANEEITVDYRQVISERSLKEDLL
jgi:hypothetical protein